MHNAAHSSSGASSIARPLTEADLRRYAINQISIPHATLAEACQLIADAGIGGIGLWRDRVASVTLPTARAMIEDQGLFISSLNIGGMFSKFGRAGFAGQVDDTRGAIAEAHALGVNTICMVAGGLPPGSRDLSDAYRMFEEGLAAVLPDAEAAGVRLLLEPLHPMYLYEWSTLTSLRRANDLCDQFGPMVALSLDVYHTWWDLEFEQEVRRAAAVPDRLAILVISDWLPVTRSLNDRGMIGDGVIDLQGIRGLLEATADYQGPIELEIFSEALWAAPPADIVQLARSRFLSHA